MEQAYKGTTFVVREDFDQFSSFERALLRLENAASPGYPYCRDATTNGDWLGFDGLRYDPVRKQALWFDVQKVMRGEWDLILRVFIKMEPHKRAKVEEGRLRLIMGVPLPVQVWWHMLFDEHDDVEIRMAYDIPSKQGMQLHGGMWRLYRQSWIEKGFNAGLDKRAWDWTVPWWKMKANLDFSYRMSRGARRDEWMECASRCLADMAKPKMILSDGSVYQQLFPGIMKSGCVTTIADNSRMQVIDHILVSEDLGVPVWPMPDCCGDDTLERLEGKTDLNVYSQYGAIVKSASEGLEFVGHEFLKMGPQPLYLEKHLAKAVTVPEEHLQDYFDSLMRLYTYSPLREFWRQWAEELGYGRFLLSDQAYRYWYEFG